MVSCRFDQRLVGVEAFSSKSESALKGFRPSAVGPFSNANQPQFDNLSEKNCFIWIYCINYNTKTLF